MSGDFDDKLERFERLWEGVTPKGVNRSKAIRFRQYMRQHVLQKFHKRQKGQFASADKGHFNVANTGWASCRRRSANRRPSEAIRCLHRNLISNLGALKPQL